MGTRELRLADDRQERADAQLAMIGQRDGNGGRLESSLHHHVVAPMTDLDEAMLFEDAARLAAREDTQPTQPLPRAW
jgi:hypothetical protein